MMTTEFKLVPVELLERVATEANHMLGFTYAANYDECRSAVDELRAMIDAPASPQAAQPVACNHEWTDDGEFTLTCTTCGKTENHEPYGWVQTRGDAINHFTQEWDIVEEWEVRGFEHKAMFDHADAGEVSLIKERENDLVTALEATTKERDALRAQLAEVEKIAAGYEHRAIYGPQPNNVASSAVARFIREALSTTAKPEADHE